MEQLPEKQNEQKQLATLKTSPKEFWKIILAPKTAIEAYKNKTLSFGALKKELPEVVLDAFLSLIVTDLIQSFNIGKTMNDMQAVFVVNAIKSDYYFLTVEEIKYVFEKAKKGGYGTMYDRIDAAVIFGWIELYIDERMQIAIDTNIEEKKIAQLGIGESIHPEIAEKLKSIFKEKTAEDVDMKLAVPKVRERTPQEKIVDGIFKEFDEIYGKPYHSPGTRMILYNNKKVTASEYLEIKLNELNEEQNGKSK